MKMGPGLTPINEKLPLSSVVVVTFCPCTVTVAPAIGVGVSFESVTVPETTAGAALSTARVRLTVVVPLDATPTPVSAYVAYPAFAASTLYAPIGTLIRENAPAASLVAVLLGGIVVTVTAPSAAMLASLTVPLIVP